jgi:hypothetical protein
MSKLQCRQSYQQMTAVAFAVIASRKSDRGGT